MASLFTFKCLFLKKITLIWHVLLTRHKKFIRIWQSCGTNMFQSLRFQNSYMSDVWAIFNISFFTVSNRAEFFGPVVTVGWWIYLPGGRPDKNSTQSNSPWAGTANSWISSNGCHKLNHWSCCFHADFTIPESKQDHTSMLHPNPVSFSSLTKLWD